jgi:hypothetical protein
VSKPCADERNRVPRHRCDAGRRFALGSADTATVEGDHAVLCRQPIHYARVIVVERRAEGVEQHDRNAGPRTEVSIGEGDAVHRDKVGRYVLEGDGMDVVISNTPSGRHRLDVGTKPLAYCAQDIHFND